MKKGICCLLILLSVFYVFAAKKTIAVLDFETEVSEIEGYMAIMTDIFRSELASSEFRIVDRKSTDAIFSELQFQSNGLTQTNNVKTIGRMLNADFIVIGHVMPIVDDPVAHTEFVTYDKKVDGGLLGGLGSLLFGDSAKKTETVVEEKITYTQESAITIVIQMIDIESAEMVASSRVDLSSWTEFSRKANTLAKSLTSYAMSGTNSFFDKESIFGVWECEIVNKNIIDTYMVKFQENGIVEVEVVSWNKNTEIETKASGRGRYTYDEMSHIISVTINRLSGNVNHIKDIVWKSLITSGDSEDVFSLIIPVGTGSLTNVRGDFLRLY